MSKMISTVAKNKTFSNFSNAKIWQTLKTAFLINIPIALLITFLTCHSCRSDWYEAWIHFAVDMLYGFGIFFGLSTWNTYLGKHLKWLINPWKSFWVALASNTLVIVIVVIIVNLIYRPILHNCNFLCVLKNLQLGDFLISLLIGLMMTAIFQAANFLSVWKVSLVETEKYKNAQLAAQYQTLNSQINPHFLFNSLNVLSTLVKKNPDKAEQFIHQLSNVYRNILDVRNEELISTQQELETLKAYLFLIETRYGERIKMDIRITPKMDEYFVPLSLQMLVENAVKHNAATLKNPLTIELYEEANFLWIKNNRKAMTGPVEGKGMGLENIRQRYQLATGKEIIVQDEETFYAVGLPMISD